MQIKKYNNSILKNVLTRTIFTKKTFCIQTQKESFSNIPLSKVDDNKT